MADSLYELLASTWDANDPTRPQPPEDDATTAQYINRLLTLSLQSLSTTEPQALAQSSHLNLRSIQALSNRSHGAFVVSADNLSTLSDALPRLARETQELRLAVPSLDAEAVQFSQKYSKTAGYNATLERRKKAMQLAKNVDRLSDILEMPTLLSTAVSSAAAAATAASSSAASASSSTAYSLALDLYAHIKRLQKLHPDSAMVREVALQAEDGLKDMTTNLIAGMRAHNIRLASAMRMVSWLRRIAPELEISDVAGARPGEGALGALFLVCRLANLVLTLEALDPLKELADQELAATTSQSAEEKLNASAGGKSWSTGHQTERYLKRYIEIYREQSFAIVSVYRNIFSPDHQPDSDAAIAGLRRIDTRAADSQPKATTPSQVARIQDPFIGVPPALSTFPMHLIDLLIDTLRKYLPNVRDKSSRESLLTQVLYCAASLGRLGGDFSLILTELEGDLGRQPTQSTEAPEWEEIMKKHRALAGRLEQLTSANGPSSTTKTTTTLPVR